MQYDDWMSASDAIMWHIERDPMLRSAITTVWLLDQPPTPERLHQTLDRAVGAIPRLSQRVHTDPFALAPPRWVAEEGFELVDHVETQVIDGHHELQDLLNLAAHIHEQPLDKARPPWELHVVEGLADGAGAIVLKVHHAIGDGLGLLQMIGALVDDRPDPVDGPAPSDTEHGAATPTTAATPAETPSLGAALSHRMASDAALVVATGRGIVHGLAGLALHPLDTAKAAARTTASLAHLLAPVTEPKSPLMVRRSLDAHFAIISRPLGDLRAIAHQQEVSINDVFIAAVTAGLDRYHRHHGVVADELRINMPVSIRTDEAAELAGNQFAPARFVIPATADDTHARLHGLRAVLSAERAEPALPMLHEVAEVINRTGPAAATVLLQAMLKAVDLVVSNVPGPDTALYTAGSEVKAMLPFGPCAGAGVNLTLLSYRDEAVVGINLDRAAVPEPDVFVASLEAGFDDLMALGDR